MDPISGRILYLSNYLVTIILFLIKNLIFYFVLSRSLVFVSTSSTISLCPSLVYLRESPIWKGEVGVLVCVESLQTLIHGLTRGLSNLCETASLISLSSTSGVKSIVLPFLGFYLVNMEAKAKLDMESLDIDPTILKN